MKNSCVVVDSNLAVFTVVDSVLSPLAIRVWNILSSPGTQLFAPGLWIYETTSVIRKYLAMGVFDRTEAKDALSVMAEMNIHFIPDDLRIRQAALNWATRLRQKAAYDGFYLAVAEQLNAQFWTADESLFNNARQIGVDWVYWMGELGSGSNAP